MTTLRPTSESDRALLILDVVRAVVEPGMRVGGIHEHPQAAAVVGALARAIEAARASGVLVVYGELAFRPGYPEVSDRNRSFSLVRAGGGFLEGAPEGATHPEIAPTKDDVVITKKRSSAFVGSDLEILLRSRGIIDLTLGGIATSGVILSTARTAADLDFRLTFLSDGCTDSDTEMHDLLVTRLFPRWGDVLMVNDWIARLQTG